ncbi:protein ABERRANT PANICLE ORGANIZATION 1-like [Salvia miltiorrhiza]|uniref:protein ABERRANT PANICLE ORGANIZATION 1-like n=1 Tax=Salvia miltiorrhiza TaxID=226208 RepID=UPI0025ABBB09|nr:protein ABERRANT PANICLE ORGANIZATION 1-like [Salvia miltiorrhiza]
MWSNLPIDLLLNIFSHLPPDSLARARAACRSWRATSELAVSRNCHPPWFVALPARGWGLSCYAHNPVKDSWHVLDLDRTTTPMRPIAAIGGLILLKLGSAARLQLAICNPFTNQFRALPALRVARTNPAVGVVEDDGDRGFKIYVAGGMSESAGGGAVYEASVEVYDSSCSGGGWGVVGAMPVELAVRLTVWTPNESVWSGDGVLYWMTSARAYSVMGFDMSSKTWREVGVPMADRLEFAALVRREGRLAVVGGTCGGGGRVWELGGGGDGWGVVGEVPAELGIRLLGEKLNWGCVKCVGVDGTICLYKDIGSGIIIWSQGKWSWIHGCYSIDGTKIMSFPIKGILLQPNLARTTF